MLYKEYEEKCEEVRAKNNLYLDEFENDLVVAGLKEKTINNHLSNVYFYINQYLLREEHLEMVEGTGYDKLNDFLGYFFICKCMWSTSGTIKSTAASIKKFYKSMLQRGNIKESDYMELIASIKENMDRWLEDCETFNNPNAPNPFTSFF